MIAAVLLTVTALAYLASGFSMMTMFSHLTGWIEPIEALGSDVFSIIFLSVFAGEL